MWSWTAPGGTLVVQEYDLRGMDVFPPLDVVHRFRDIFAALGPGMDAGHRLPSWFDAAGIGEPDGTHVAGRMERFDRAFSGMIAAVHRSILPAAV
jgi:hypothetical protein